MDREVCETLLVPHLKELCKWLEVKRFSVMRKNELIDNCCVSSSERGKICFDVDSDATKGGLI